jgi:hypothetical protein
MSEICLIDGTNHKSLISLRRYVKRFGMSPKDYYDTYVEPGVNHICPLCGMDTPFVKGKYRRFCDIKCSSYYNGKNYKPTFNEISKKKISDSWKNRDPDWIIKRRETIEKKYGVTYTEYKSNQWNVRLSNMTEKERVEFYDKAVSSQGFSKSRKFKEYQLGENTILVQGYEPCVLDILKTLYLPNDIIVGRNKNTMVRYIDSENKNRRYFPDIFLPDNVIIEVKSIYTLMNNLEETLIKMDASYKQGYKPILVVWEVKLDKVNDCKESLIEIISSRAWNTPGRFNDYPFIGVGHKQTMLEALGIQIGS